MSGAGQAVPGEVPGGFFHGFPREDGRPGVRNYLLVLNITGLTNPAARKISDALTGSQLVSMPFGAAIRPSDDERTMKVLASLCRHPNVGAVLAISADRARSERLENLLKGIAKPVSVMDLGDHRRDILTFVTQSVRSGARMALDISKQRRRKFAISELCVGVECGLSDPTSGLVANPLIGDVVNRVVLAGGSAIFGETTEWLGSEHKLAERAINACVAAKLLAAVGRREREAAAHGLDLTGNNPNRANIEAGLTTIEDKAIGSTAKSGTVPINAVIGYGEIAGQGLSAQDGASYTPESLTGLVASGAQLCLFATGLGNSYVSALSPTIKITGNPDTSLHLGEQIDFDASQLLQVPALRNAMAQALLVKVTDVASGTKTFGEILGEGDEIISRYGESL